MCICSLFFVVAVVTIVAVDAVVAIDAVDAIDAVVILMLIYNQLPNQGTARPLSCGQQAGGQRVYCCKFTNH